MRVMAADTVCIFVAALLHYLASAEEIVWAYYAGYNNINDFEAYMVFFFIYLVAIFIPAFLAVWITEDANFSYVYMMSFALFYININYFRPIDREFSHDSFMVSGAYMFLLAMLVSVFLVVWIDRKNKKICKPPEK